MLANSLSTSRSSFSGAMSGTVAFLTRMLPLLMTTSTPPFASGHFSRSRASASRTGSSLTMTPPATHSGGSGSVYQALTSSVPPFIFPAIARTASLSMQTDIRITPVRLSP